MLKKLHLSIPFVQLQIVVLQWVLCEDSCDKFIFSQLWVKWQNLRKKPCCISVQYCFYELLKPATLTMMTELRNWARDHFSLREPYSDSYLVTSFYWWKAKHICSQCSTEASLAVGQQDLNAESEYRNCRTLVSGVTINQDFRFCERGGGGKKGEDEGRITQAAWNHTVQNHLYNILGRKPFTEVFSPGSRKSLDPSKTISTGVAKGECGLEIGCLLQLKPWTM